MTNEKSFAEIQAMTTAERRDYYAQREKGTNSRPVKKIRGPTRKLQKRRNRRITNRQIRQVRYDRPFHNNPQFQPKIIIANKRKQVKLLRKLGYRTPVPSQ